MKTLFTLLSALSAFFVAMIAGIVFTSTNLSDFHTYNWKFIGWELLVHGFLWFIAILTVGTYFGNDIWKSKKYLDKETIKYRNLNKELEQKIKLIGEHEALKIINN